jgi:hypothetical protein
MENLLLVKFLVFWMYPEVSLLPNVLPQNLIVFKCFATINANQTGMSESLQAYLSSLDSSNETNSTMKTRFSGGPILKECCSLA